MNAFLSLLAAFLMCGCSTKPPVPPAPPSVSQTFVQVTSSVIVARPPPQPLFVMKLTWNGVSVFTYTGQVCHDLASRIWTNAYSVQGSNGTCQMFITNNEPQSFYRVFYTP